MTSYKLKRSSRLADEEKNILDIDYFIIEEFKIRNNSKSYGIKVETKNKGQITDTCTVNDLTTNLDEAMYIISKMADNNVSAIAAKDVIEDMVY